MPEFPPAFEAWVYRALYPELAHLDDSLVLQEYNLVGRLDGRRGHQVHDRIAFCKLIPKNVKALEIGPFAAPLVRTQNVKYADIYSTSELNELAPTLNFGTDEIPEIHWVVDPNDLSTIDEKFAIVLTSHVIEHSPNLVAHLNQIENLLKLGGRYFLLIPDHRYCFDHFHSPSTISQIIGAHIENRRTHTATSFIETRLLHAHNDPIEHWAGNHGAPAFHPVFPLDDRIKRVQDALQLLQSGHIVKNEHAWYFTPDTFESIINDLNDLEIINLEIERMYPTMKDSGEFWVILRSKN